MDSSMIRTLCTIGLAVLFAAPASTQARTYGAHEPAWAGQWVWAPVDDDAPALVVDLHRWLVAHPGGWGPALTHRLVGHAAASGLAGVYWRLEDARGRRLYPSKQRGDVLAWPNWGADFAAFDFPASAIEVAAKCDLPITLVASTEAVADEARQRYPGVRVVLEDELTSLPTIPAATMEPAALAQRYLSRDTQRFRRVFEIDSAIQNAEMTLTAERAYRVYLDGVLIGVDSDWWRGETFDLTDLLDPGRHVVAVEVSPDDQYAGLLLNLRWTGSEGASHLLTTDTSWRVAAAGDDEDWARLGYDAGDWVTPNVVGFEGVGPRFRLKEPWRNPTPVRGGEVGLPTHLVEHVEVRADGATAAADRVVDGSPADASSWRTDSMPATLELVLPEPTRLREVRVHSGMLGFHGNPSGASSLKSYQLQTYEDGEWVNLVPPVDRAPAYEGQPREQFVQYHAFSPRMVSRLRLVIRASHDTGRRVRCPEKPCVRPEERVCYIREIEIIKSFGE